MLKKDILVVNYNHINPIFCGYLRRKERYTDNLPWHYEGSLEGVDGAEGCDIIKHYENRTIYDQTIREYIRKNYNANFKILEYFAGKIDLNGIELDIAGATYEKIYNFVTTRNIMFDRLIELTPKSSRDKEFQNKLINMGYNCHKVAHSPYLAFQNEKYITGVYWFLKFTQMQRLYN